MSVKKNGVTRAAPPAARPTQEQPAQFAFLDSPTERLTKSFGLWDMTPWQVVYTQAEFREGNFLKSIVRTFEARGRTYRLTLRPARINREGVEVEAYPGECEHLIELAIRKLAIRQRNMQLEANELVTLTLKVYDLYKELHSTGHPFTYPRIEEGLQILRNAHFEISRLDVDNEGETYETVISSNILPTMKLRKFKDAEKVDRTTVNLQVNALLAEAIRNLDIYDVNYEKLMGLKVVSRWIYKYLHHAIVFGECAEVNELTINARMVQEACGLTFARSRQLLAAISGHVNELAKPDVNVIETVTEEPVFTGTGKTRAKTDVIYHIVPSAEFLAQALQSQVDVASNLETFRVISGGRRPSEGWLKDEKPVETRTAIRTGRKSRADGQPKLPFLELVESK